MTNHAVGAAREKLRSIGQVLASLQPEFPNASISKIRFLKAEGLLQPHHAASGYRRYSAEDERRLRYILEVQRDHYLPLKVIAEHLDMMDRGMQPPMMDNLTPTPPEAPAPETAAPVPEPPVRLSRAELLETTGLNEPALVELERFQIVVAQRGSGFYGREALTVARAAKRLAEFGLDARHLRAIKMSADREVGLVEQAIAPYVRRAGGDREVAVEVINQVTSVHTALVRTAFER